MTRKTTTTEPLAQRMRKPGMRDPKLLIGLLLIAVSVFAVVTIVRVANRTETFYVAAHDISVGDRLTVTDLKPVEVRLAESSNQYLATDSVDAQFAIDNIAAGELVSKNDLASSDQSGRRLASIVLDSAIAQGFSSGDRVDIWVSKKAQNGSGYEDPETIATGAEVSRVESEESVIGGTGKSAVQVLVEEGNLADVLAAVNNEDKINLVPTNFAGSER